MQKGVIINQTFAQDLILIVKDIVGSEVLLSVIGKEDIGTKYLELRKNTIILDKAVQEKYLLFESLEQTLIIVLEENDSRCAVTDIMKVESLIEGKVRKLQKHELLTLVQGCKNYAKQKDFFVYMHEEEIDHYRFLLENGYKLHSIVDKTLILKQT